MMGRYFARFEESPTEKRLNQGSGLVKPYWGEGTERAKNWQRYHTGGKEELNFEEGVEGWVPYAGNLSEGVRKSLAVIKSTMCNLGCLNLEELHKNSVAERRSPSSIVEGKPHDVRMSDTNLWNYRQLSWGE
jgi:IMP dehydrogenase